MAAKYIELCVDMLGAIEPGATLKDLDRKGYNITRSHRKPATPRNSN